MVHVQGANDYLVKPGFSWALKPYYYCRTRRMNEAYVQHTAL